MRVVRYLAIALVLVLLGWLCLPETQAAWWGVHFAVNQIGPTPTATVTSTPSVTPTGSPTGTPTPSGLPAAITAMLADQATGVTNPYPTLCAASNVSSPGGTLSGNCTQSGSVNTASIPKDGVTDASSQLQTAVNAGDVNLPAGTYLINNADVNVPSWRTIQCQPGAVLTTTQTTRKVLAFTNTVEDTVFNCTFVGPGNVGTLNPAYAIFASGASLHGLDLVGNSFTGWPSASAVNFSSVSNSTIFLNQFAGNHDTGINLAGSTHIQSIFNEQNGVITPTIPAITVAGGTQAERDLWGILNALGAGGTAAANGYTIVQPGITIGGATCSGNGVNDDTNCIKNALAAATSSTGILVLPGTGATPRYQMIAAQVSGANLNGKTVLCAPGARFFNPNQVSSNNTQPIFNVGFGGVSGGSNINVIGCEFYGPYNSTPPTPSAGQFYGEMIEIAPSNNSSQITAIGDDFEHCAGDCFISYSPCGTLLNQSSCGGGTPQTSGPNDTTVLFSYFNQSNQSCVHVNGGQNEHFMFSKFLDCDVHNEVDTNVMQIEGDDINNNYVFSTTGDWDTIGGFNHWVTNGISCTGRQNVGVDSSLCFGHDNTADGSQTISTVDGFNFPTIDNFTVLNPGQSGNTGVNCKPGTWSGSNAVNGAAVNNDDC